MNNKRIAVNSVFAVLQVIVTSVGLFLLLRLVLDELGAEQLGVWSLVLSSASLTRAANLGLSGSVVKFVAKYASYEDHDRISEVMQTTLVTVGLLSASVLLVVYFFSEFLLGLVLDAHLIEIANAILPIAIFSVWLSVLARIVVGGLDGYQKIDVRSVIMMVSVIVYVIGSYLMVEPLGLVGLAYAQTLQNVVIIVIGYFFLRRYTQFELPIISYKWNRAVFFEMFNYGLNFQVISVVAMLYEPTVKYLLAIFGGVDAVGFYELAARMVLQFRSLIVTANNVLVPTFADLTEREPAKVRHLYEQAVSLTSLISYPLYVGIVIILPAISILWIGDINTFFIGSAILLIIGWYVNTLAAPSYFAFLGNGRLTWAMIAQVTIGVLNLGFGWLFGSLIGPYGPIVGWMVSLVLGSSIIIGSYHYQEKIPFSAFTNRNNIILILVGIAVSICAYVITYGGSVDQILVRNLITVPIVSIFLLLGMWLNPTSRWLVAQVNKSFKSSLPFPR